MLGGTVTYPYILTSKLCMRDSDPAKGYVIATTLFCSGIASFIQTTFGIRLPVIQGATFTFLVPTLAILSLPQWQCPTDFQIIATRPRNSTFRNWRTVADEEYTEVWESRMREVQGAIIMSSLVEVVIGLTGVMGFMLRYITPLSIVPTITLIGLSLFKEATAPAGESWLISGITIMLVIIFSQYLVNMAFPYPKIRVTGETKGVTWHKGKVIRMFPVLLTMLIAWSLCGLLTTWNAFPPDHPARTDGIMRKLVQDSPWIRVPYPFQWGWPTFSASAVLGMTAGVVASALESVGDYYACARLCETASPPTHAVNRGILMEGLGCVLSGIMGSGGGLTSYSENVGAIGITRVASRRVVQSAAVMMIMLSVFVKISALFATIPIPIIGGVLMTMFGLCSAVGLSNLQFVDLNSPRNIFILGSSLFLGLSIPKWVLDHPENIRTGSSNLDQVLYVLLSTSMFVGGAIAFFLDNTIPGSEEERGVKKWLTNNGGPTQQDKSHYDLPSPVNSWFKRLKFLPVSPSYTETEITNRVRKISHSLNFKRKNQTAAVTTAEVPMQDNAV